ncbi:MAG: DUF4157 domain-containing protein [Nostoc sp. S4]|nr:DUF4157 domain-containing protein [Nostoc sp. S4]
MKERIIQPKKITTDSFSIPALRQPTRGFGSQSSGASPQAALSKPVVHDISRIPLRRPQTKLTVNQPGDIYEQEADTVAQQVMGKLAQPGNSSSMERQQMPEEELQMKPLASSITPLVQLQEIPEEEEEELQMKSLDNGTLQREEHEDELQMMPMVQRQSEAGMAAAPDLEASINQAREGGQPIAKNIREPMEQVFGADFSGVKVHTDGQSDELNQSIQARAFTTGQDVFFRQGQYNPGSQGGHELLAHELTHVVQQNRGTVQPQLTDNTSLQTATETPQSNTLIQRSITIDGDYKSRDRDYQQVWQKYKNLKLNEQGDGKIIENIIRDTQQDYGELTWDGFVELVKSQRKPKATKKRKSNEKPENYVPRVDARAVGTEVDWGTDRVFRPDRRLRREAKKQGNDIGERNVYMVKKRKLDGTSFKLITVSHPPGQVAKSEIDKPIDQLVAKYNPGHSENITDVVETSSWDQVKDTTREKEATTREQCKDCRHTYPSQVDPGSHYFGFRYSAPEDHIVDPDFLNKITENKGHMWKGMTEEQKKQFHQAEDSATYARQNDPAQNPKLKQALKDLTAEHSEDEYSSDDEPYFVDQPIAEALGIQTGTSKTIGKAEIFPIPPEFQVPLDKAADKQKWVKEQIKLRNEDTVNNEAMDVDIDSDAEDA